MKNGRHDGGFEKRVGLLRACVSLYLLIFIGFTLFFPHDHTNPLADLTSEARSNSGSFVAAATAHAGARGQSWSAGIPVDDDACLACFWTDVTASASRSFAVDLPDRGSSRAPGFSSTPAPSIDRIADAERGPPAFPSA
jgi:hypothetical protein